MVTVVLIVAGVTTAIALLYLNGTEWACSRRSARLCLSCHAVRQPACKLIGRLLCPICEAAGPVPLRSHEARLYFAMNVRRELL